MNDSFRTRLTALTAFRNERGRLPSRRSHDRYERALAHTLHGLRQASRGLGHIAWTDARRTALDQELPGWEGDSRARQNERFARRAVLTATFQTEHGRSPSADAHDPDERALGRWVVHVRAAAQGRGTMAWTPERDRLTAGIRKTN